MQNPNVFQNPDPNFLPELDTQEIQKRIEADRKVAKLVATQAYYEYAPKPFAVEFRTAYQVCTAFFYLFMAFSVLMALVPLAWYFMEVVGQQPVNNWEELPANAAVVGVGFLTAFLLLAGNEGVKAVSQSKAMKSYFAERRLSTAAFWIWVAFVLVSGCSSTWGAYEFTYKSRQPKQGAELKAESGYYDSEIAKTEARLKEYVAQNSTKERGKSVLRYNAAKGYETLQNEISELRKQRERNQLHTDSQNEKMKSQAHTDGRAAGAIAVVIAVLIEAGLVGFGIFRAKYTWESEYERRRRTGAQDGAQGGQQQPQFVPAPPITGGGGSRPPSQIGFKIYENRMDENRVDENPSQKTCKNCGKPFHSNHKKQLYCGDSCRVDFWEKDKNRKLKFKAKKA